MTMAKTFYAVVAVTIPVVGSSACDAEPMPESTELEVVEPQPEVIKAAERESRIQSVPFTPFEDDIGDAGTDETVRVITDAFSYQLLFGNAPPADLDFSDEWVLFYSAGLQPTGGFEAGLGRLVHVPTWGLLYAEPQLTEPGEDCLVPQVITKPHILARFPVPSPRPYYFSSSIETDVVDCEPPAESIEVEYDFNHGAQQWSTHFSDLPQDYDPYLFELVGEISTLPSELGAGTGFLLGGSNRSDDLWMGLERQLGPADGVEPGQAYTLEYELRFGSNAATGCFGIGGAPGESVHLKAGGAGIDPEPSEVSLDGFTRMNIDKGNQAVGGSDVSRTGDIANGIPCENSDLSYASLTRSHTHPEPVTADANGNLWLVVGTDSGFEGRTELYYQSIAVTLTPQ